MVHEVSSGASKCKHCGMFIGVDKAKGEDQSVKGIVSPLSEEMKEKVKDSLEAGVSIKTLDKILQEAKAEKAIVVSFDKFSYDNKSIQIGGFRIAGGDLPINTIIHALKAVVRTMEYNQQNNK